MKLFLKWDILKEDYQKFFKSLMSFLFPNPVSFYGNYYEKQKWPRTSYQYLFKMPNMFRSSFSLVIHDMSILDTLIQRDCWVIPKIATDKLWKPFHDAIISFSTSCSNVETLDKKEELFKNVNTSKTNWVF